MKYSSSYTVADLEPFYEEACEGLRNYLQNCLPEEVCEISGLRLLSLEAIKTENIDEFHPGCELFPLGFLVIATSIGGNVICVDMTAGVVYWCDSAIFVVDGVVEYYNPLEKRWISAEKTKEGLPAAMVMLAGDIGTFLQDLSEGRYLALVRCLDGASPL